MGRTPFMPASGLTKWSGALLGTSVPSAGDENLPEIYATLSRVNLSRYFFLERLPPET